MNKGVTFSSLFQTDTNSHSVLYYLCHKRIHGLNILLLFYELTNVTMLFIDYRHQTQELMNYFQLTNLEILGSPFFTAFLNTVSRIRKKQFVLLLVCCWMSFSKQNLTCLQQNEAGTQTGCLFVGPRPFSAWVTRCP